MIFRFIGQIFMIVVFVLSSTVYADATFHFDKNRVPYQFRQSSQELVDIHEQLRTHNISLVGLEKIISDLKRISKIGHDCQVELKKGLQQIDNISNQIKQVEDKIGFEETYKNFEYDKKVKKGTLIYCQLISYYSEKYLFEANQQLFQKPKNRMHQVALSEILNTPHLMDYPLQLNNLSIQFGLDYFNAKYCISMLIVFILSSALGLIVGLKLRQFQKMNYRFLSYLFLDKMIYILPIFLPVFAEMVYVIQITSDLLNPPFVRMLLSMVCFNLFILYLLLIIAKGIQYENNKEWGKKITYQTIHLFLINAIHILFIIIFSFVFQNNPLVDLLFKVFFVVWSSIVVYCWYLLLNTCTEYQYYSARIHGYIQRLHAFFPFAIIVMQIVRINAIVIGQDVFAVNLSAKIFIFSFCILLAFLFSQLFIKIFSNLEQGAGRFVKYFRYILNLGGANLQQKEFAYFKILLTIYFVVLGIPLFMRAMEVPSSYLIQFNQYIYDGFDVFYFKLIPIRLLNAITLFSFVIFIAKWSSKYTSRTIFAKYDSDRRSTLSLIVKYIGFSLAFMIAIGILGISLENLSMIIGFFSLGIGIGMQSIAIDLISGLIVLAHKPIRINDYVSLSMDSSTITGHIQKILLLSTQIITDDQSVVHVRNANLLKANLENHTLFNQITKCFIPFSLSEVTDFEKAKAIILNVVKKKNEIVQSGASGPVVLLDSTNAKDYESSVVINLLFYMKNIELKQYVIDDIMKSIRQEFQKKGVKYMMFHDNPHK
jgi:potassium efflux system protein